MLNPVPERFNSWDSVKYGAWRGMVISWAYAFVLGIIWTFFSPDLKNIVMPERLIGLLWFWGYGYLFGAIVGLSVGAVTGYIISHLLTALVPRRTQHAWLLGLITCTGLWLIVHFTLGQAILTSYNADDVEKAILLHKLLIAYPGLIYIISGTYLAHRVYAQSKTV